MKFLSQIIFLLMLSFSVHSSVLVYGIDYKNNIFKVKNATYFSGLLVEGDVIEIILNNSIYKSVEVVDVINDDKLILKIDDISLIHHGMSIDIVEDSEELDYKYETSKNYDNYEYISSNNSFSYQLNSGGLRSYFEDELYEKNKFTYNKLNSKLILLETRSSFGTLIGGIGLLVGGGMALLAGSVDKSNELSPEDEKKVRLLGLQGLLILLIGGGIGKALIPQKYEYVNLVNKINSLVNKDILKFEGERIIKDKDLLSKEKFSFIGDSQSMSIQYAYRF